MEPLVVTAAVAVGVAVALAGIEVALRVLLPGRLDARLTRAFGGPTTVDLPAPPLLPHVLRRRLPDVVIRATGVPVGDADGRLDRLDVHLLGLRFLRRGQPGGRVTAEAARFEATLLEADLHRLGGLPPIVRELELEPDALWVTTVAGVRIATEVAVRGGDLVVRPRSRSLASLPFAELVVALPTLPAGAVVTDVRLGDGVLVATGPVDGDRLIDP